MQIKIKFFASLAEIVGCRETVITIEDKETVESVWNQVAGDRPMPDGTLCAINRIHCEFDREVKNNDEVAYFPPMTGG